jgi:hypothetical protein
MEQEQPAGIGPVERGVGRPVPERASACGLTECAGKQECVRCEFIRLDGAPREADAKWIGATGGRAHEGERLAFEAWMAGHCWALGATWNGSGYISDREGASGGSYVCPQAMQTRRLWAAWRDRAALARLKTPNVRGKQP